MVGGEVCEWRCVSGGGEEVCEWRCVSGGV